MNRDGKKNDAIAKCRGILQNASGCTVDLSNHYRSSPAFLICSGPSLNDLDLGRLLSRGVLTCTVNNAGALYRSHLWVGYDPPENFCDVIWKDPGILKFIPCQYLDQTIRKRDGNGELVSTGEPVGEMPATFGYKSNRFFQPEHWLEEDSINCGGRETPSSESAENGTRSVLLVALRLLHYLGVRKVFLLGCDFRMSYARENYAFAQSRTRRSIRANNNLYRNVSEMLTRLLPYFERDGFEVFNCNRVSCLTVFPFIDFEEAIEIATESIPKQIETKGMYDKRQQT